MWWGWLHIDGHWHRLCNADTAAECASKLDRLVVERWGRPKNNLCFGVTGGGVPSWEPKGKR